MSTWGQSTKITLDGMNTRLALFALFCTLDDSTKCNLTCLTGLVIICTPLHKPSVNYID